MTIYNIAWTDTAASKQVTYQVKAKIATKLIMILTKRTDYRSSLLGIVVPIIATVPMWQCILTVK